MSHSQTLFLSILEKFPGEAKNSFSSIGPSQNNFLEIWASDLVETASDSTRTRRHMGR